MPWYALLPVLVLATSHAAAVTDAQEPATRAAAIEQAESERAQTAHPFKPGTAEVLTDAIYEAALTGQLRWHPFWTSAYSGGGFTLGAGYLRYLSAFNTLDVRGSVTFSGYKRVEAEFIAPRLFHRIATLSVLGGWREATQVGFYGLGTAGTSPDNRANYDFQQPYASALLDVRPTSQPLHLRGGFEASRWSQGPASGGTAPSVESIYSPATIPGLGASPAYLHSQVAIGIDTRPAAGYARRGGLYQVTGHDFSDTGGQYGFEQVDYEAIQHIPILREAWVISLRGRVQTTYHKGGESVPFFMLPALGGGSDLRAFASWRFRDQNALLTQAEWRAIVNRFFETAVFADAGKVTARRTDLGLSGLKSDYGLGFRFHGPTATPLRIDLAYGSEGFGIVFAASEVF